MPSDWQDNPGYAPVGDFETVEVLYGDELTGVGLAAELDWDLGSPLPLRIMKWRYAHARDKTPPPADKPPGSGEGAAPAETRPSPSALPFTMADVPDSNVTLDKDFNVQETLNERERLYGNIEDLMTLSQEIQGVMRASKNWWELMPAQREALQMIASKLARILNGDPNYKDNWHDIQGYARLAEDRCKSS